MLRRALVLAFLLLGSRAAAQDWWLVSVDYEAPKRQLVLMDMAGLDQSNPAMPQIELAVLFEEVDEEGTGWMIARHRFDCANDAFTILHMETYDMSGTSIRTVLSIETPFFKIQPGTRFDMARLVICNPDWPMNMSLGEGKTIEALAVELLRRGSTAPSAEGENLETLDGASAE